MNNKVYIVSLKMATSGGSGVTHVILNRAKSFTLKGYDTGILNFDDEIKTEYTKDEYINSGRILENTKWINIFQYYCDKNSKNNINIKKLTKKYISKKLNTFMINRLEPDDNTIKYYKKRLLYKEKVFDIGKKTHIETNIYNDNGVVTKQYKYDRNGYLRQIIKRTKKTGSIKSIMRFTPDGFCYFSLVKSKNKSKTISLNNRDGGSIVFDDIQNFYTHWLNELSRPEKFKPFIIFDRKEIALSGVNMEKNISHNMQILHSSHLAGPSYDDPSEIKKTREPLLSRMNDIQTLVVLTESQKKDIIHKYGNHDNITVIPNSYRATTSKKDVKKDTKQFIMVARLSGEKRVNHAIKAMSYVVKSYPDAKLIICGDGRRKDVLQKNINDLSLKDNVSLLGYKQIKEIDILYKKSIACVMTSNYEGLPLTILESMDNKTIVISYDLKYGPSDTIVDNKTGYLVTKNDIKELSNKMIEVLDDPEKAIKMGEKSKKYVEANYSDKVIMKKWTKLFDSMLSK